ncbi:hypothetical protein HYW11_03315 [Candidatus Peregrinibacteria bacterium]|nr:hypothetical protein [Candidatus Peregrinibacteria bacterium]
MQAFHTALRHFGNELAIGQDLYLAAGRLNRRMPPGHRPQQTMQPLPDCFPDLLQINRFVGMWNMGGGHVQVANFSCFLGLGSDNQFSGFVAGLELGRRGLLAGSH